MELFITKLFEQPAFYVSMVASFAGSICVHEFCHAFVAHHLGDNTAKEGGYMTVNPLKVMGWMSIAALLLFGFSWGAVPVKRDDPNRLRRSLISLAGPLSNLLLLLIAALFLKELYTSMPSAALDGGFIFYCRTFLICAVYANATLFLFNIIPIPVLDGWGIIEPFLPKSLIPSEKSKSTIFNLFIYIVCFSSTSGHFDKALDIFTKNFLPSQLHAKVLVNDGMTFLKNKDYSGSYQAFSKAAEQGSPKGKMYLALCLMKGYGCDTNFDKAFALFSEDDVRDFPMARFYRGVMSMNGISCPQDYGKAYELLSQEDVQRSFPLARANLGVLLAEGFGVKKDPARAYALLKDKKVMELSPVARFHVATYLMQGEVCEKDERRAFSLLNDEKVLDSLPQAKYLLGSWYYAGHGTKQDFAKAASLLKAAADAGEPNAAQFLGYQAGKMPDYGCSLEELLKRYWETGR